VLGRGVRREADVQPSPKLSEFGGADRDFIPCGDLRLGRDRRTGMPSVAGDLARKLVPQGRWGADRRSRS
jgi:hypothetical protein